MKGYKSAKSYFKHVKSYFKDKNPRVKEGKYNLYYHIDPKSALDDNITKHGIINDWIATNLGKYVEANSIVFDIGANAGFLSLPFAKVHVNKGKVYAYEPEKDVFEQLKRNIELNRLKNIIPLSIALQDDANKEKITFYKRKTIDGDFLENRGLSSLEPISLHRVDEYIIECSTIDKEMEKRKIPRLDFIKIDVEGSEYKVLHGGIQTISQFNPHIQYEYSTTIDKLINSQNTLESFEFLKDLGYIQFKIFDEKKLVEIKEYEPKLDVNIIGFHKSKIPLEIN